MSAGATRRWAVAAAVVVGGALAGCGGGGDGDGATSTQIRTSATPDPTIVPQLPPGDTPGRVASNFAAITGVRLQVRPGADANRLEVASGGPDRRARLGTFELSWACDQTAKRAVLGDGPQDDDGLVWQQRGGEAVVGAAFGPCLVATSPQPVAGQVDGSWLRLRRALEVTVTGDLTALPENERPCRRDPLAAAPDDAARPPAGTPSACAVDGLPVTVVDGDEELRTLLLEARVLGVETTNVLVARDGRTMTTGGDQQFAIVSYRVRNTGGRPIRRLVPQLRVGGRTFASDPAVDRATAAAFPLQPTDTLTAQALFTLPGRVADRVHQDGAFVLPTGETDTQPDAAVEQGWVRLAQASRTLP